jgi:hypothetical protein
MTKSWLKSMVLGVLWVAATPLAAAAQPQYPPPLYNSAPPATPPSWSYDPYTSGQAPCPQRLPGDLTTCQQNMPPTYGQPSYWPTR